MCNPGLIAVGLMLAGTAAQHHGQKQAAKKTKRAFDEERRAQNKLRKKSLDQAEETVDQSDPRRLAEDIDKPVQTAADEGEAAQAIASAFSDPSAPAAGGEMITSAKGAARDAGRTGRNKATLAGLPMALSDRVQALRRLMGGNALLAEDSRRSLAGLPGRLERAGRAGAGWRLAGGLAAGIGQGVGSNAAWAGDPNAGLIGADDIFNAETGTGSRLLRRN